MNAVAEREKLLSIVVCDESAGNRDLIGHFLTNDMSKFFPIGKTFQFADGTSLRELLQRDAPDISLFIFGLGKSGMETYRQLRLLEKYEEIPVLLFSARFADPDVLINYRTGLSDDKNVYFCRKNVPLEELQAVVSRILQK